jgi:hypothetical protein
MNPQGDIRELLQGELPKPDEIEVPAADVDEIRTWPRARRRAWYRDRAKRRIEGARQAMTGREVAALRRAFEHELAASRVDYPRHLLMADFDRACVRAANEIEIGMPCSRPGCVERHWPGDVVSHQAEP